jgi:hypothetical protein
VPLVALAVVAYAAGLALGFGGVLHLLVGVSAGLLVAARIRRDTRLVALAVVSLAGGLSAHSAALDDARCTQARGPVLAVFPDHLAPGAFVRGATRSIGGHRCTAPIMVAVQAGRVRAGHTAVVTGEASASRGRLFVRAATVRAGHDRDELVAFRARLGRGLDTAFGPNAALARALLIADTRSLDPAVRDR